MNWSTGRMAVCLALGAAITFAATNVRVHFEMADSPQVAAQPTGPMPLPPVRSSDLPAVADANVVRAGEFVPAIPGVAIPPVTPIGVTSISEIVSVTDKTPKVQWPVTPAPALMTRTPTIAFVDEFSQEAIVTLKIKDGTEFSVVVKAGKWATMADKKTLTLNLDHAELPKERIKGRVIATIVEPDAVPQRKATAQLRVPTALANETENHVVVAKYRNSLAPDALDVPNRTIPAPVPVYGTPSGTFLELLGSSANGSNKLAFLIQLDAAGSTIFEHQPGVAVAESSWVSQRSLPSLPTGSTGFIAVRAEFGDEHTYALNRVPFLVATTDVSKLAAPSATLYKTGPDAELRRKTVPGIALPAYFSNSRAMKLSVTPDAKAQAIHTIVDGTTLPPKAVTGTAAVEIPFTVGDGRDHAVRIAFSRGNDIGDFQTFEVRARTEGATVEDVSATGFGQSGGVENIQLRFNTDNPLDAGSARNAANYKIVHDQTLPANQTVAIKSAPAFDPLTNTVTLSVGPIVPGSYTLGVVNASKVTGAVREGLLDVYGNPAKPLLGDTAELAYSTQLFTGEPGKALPVAQPGITFQTGPNAVFPDFLSRPVSPAGFNPADRVETRVVRLYYYRDAHRVSQIVNRDVKSYNRAGVDVRHRAAERARDDANKATDERKRLDQVAIRAAEDSRAAEAELKRLEYAVEAAGARASMLPPTDPARDDALRARDAAQAQIPAAKDKVARLRQTEAQMDDARKSQEQVERRSHENLFRLEVAAAKEDPGTYVPGKTDSIDPVLQCSMSVIGEGLIQVRGPLKGINVIRIMINQIDAPVGQVRVGVHTVQVNGDRGDRMEKVVANIQRYIDHSRFLTAQSTQMLRNAVTVVASRKAAEIATLNCSQEERDRKYLHAFFGKDFIDELALIDSEFLKTGNKLLSLHSMNSTSLSSALFLIALAKNDIRREILAEFQAQLAADLPQAEFNYYLAGLTGAKCEACADKKHYLLAYNAKFQSFLGFFNAEVAGSETMNPLQREFIRLAQIFKAELVTEIVLRQRVLERSLIEERIGPNYEEQMREAVKQEQAALKKLAEVREKLPEAIIKAQGSLLELMSRLDEVYASLENINLIVEALGTDSKRVMLSNNSTVNLPPLTKVQALDGGGDFYELKPGSDLRKSLERLEILDQFYYISSKSFADYKFVTDTVSQALASGRLYKNSFESLQKQTRELKGLALQEAGNLRGEFDSILNSLRAGQPADIENAVSRYSRARQHVFAVLRRGKPLQQTAESLFKLADAPFQELQAYRIQAQKAAQLRHPLDKKKLLDLLVDDIEDKYIEQLEGTRAHTANVDNYIKTITTALDDDLNTQFYFPAFRKVREASRLWDVTLGQIETTTILTNNREFAKVSPSATMEFDLPKRDIMITEGFRSAKALFDEYGALMNDPTFLALGKLYSGVPSTGQINSANVSSVRNVLPGLSGQPDETVMAQGGPGRREFGSALEALIPDPAVYKFETGTGFEIRPVLAPDGQAVVFDFDYLYTTDVREPVRADEKHLGRVKRHFIHTDVQLSNFELREVSKYLVALKVSRTAKGVPFLQDIPGVGMLFRPLPSAESALQENIVYSQATIFPTLFDLMGLRYARSIADLDPLATRMTEFAARNRDLDLMQRIADIGATGVDDAVRIPGPERRKDLYRPPVTIPSQHPDGYVGPGERLRDSNLIEGPLNPYDPRQAYPATPYSPFQTWSSATKPLPPESYLPPSNLNPPSFGVYPPPPNVPLGTTIYPGVPPLNSPMNPPASRVPNLNPPRVPPANGSQPLPAPRTFPNPPTMPPTAMPPTAMPPTAVRPPAVGPRTTLPPLPPPIGRN